jgi:hypothetical protein
LYRVFKLLNFSPSIQKVGRGLQEILLVENSNSLFHVSAPYACKTLNTVSLSNAGDDGLCASSQYGQKKTREYNTPVQPELSIGAKKMSQLAKNRGLSPVPPAEQDKGLGV